MRTIATQFGSFSHFKSHTSTIFSHLHLSYTQHFAHTAKTPTKFLIFVGIPHLYFDFHHFVLHANRVNNKVD